MAVLLSKWPFCMKLLLVSLFLIGAFFLFSCDKKAEKEQLLTTVLAHYQSPADSLQRKAATFLINNMDGLSTGESETEDLGKVDAEYLIKNIDLAFKMTAGQLKNDSLSFNDFCEYVLPYRLANEPLTPWREQGLKQYAYLLDTFQLAENKEVGLSSNINTKISKGFRYTTTAQPAKYLSWEQLMQDKQGNCWAMTSLLNYPLRALGMAVATDFVPKWGNNNGETHAWNALRISDKKWIPFMGCERNPGDFDPFNIINTKRLPAKVFRMTNSINRETLPHLVKDKDDIPYQLFYDRIIDVTDQYRPVGDISVQLDNPDIDIAYLGVFSNGNWSPVFWAKSEKQQCVFRNMARGIVYIPCTYSSDDGVKLIGSPVYIDELTGKIVRSKPDAKNKITISIAATQSKSFDELAVFAAGKTGLEFIQALDSICLDLKYSPPIQNQNYRLFYWDNGWQLAGEKKKTGNAPLQFGNVPAGALYRLMPENQTNKERFFSYSNGKQMWW
jgi:hypothetical protein